ncbi:hypothetical protein [Streptomyces sp. NPDC056194]|uniref:hypothetical protein n=1 Tax=Streptomyces sp. NPDC056194 TaxID=3345744 RepID=UPI0035E1DEDB
MLTTDGAWVELETDPLEPFEEIDDWNKTIEAAGYYKWGVFGRPDESPLWLEVHRRKTTPGLTVPLFLVVVTNHGYCENVYAESLPAMMDLQSRWAPVIQAAAVTDLLGKLDDSQTTYGFAGMVRNALS